jgi:ribosomal protein S18 acetylase RimI-like enzyme
MVLGMFEFGSLNKVLKKLMVTLRDFKKTAYHHYGKSPFSFIKFLYYSGIRINTFFVYENDLSRELPEHNLDPDFRVVKPTLEELARFREGLELTREFYYDKIYNAKTCYLVFKGDEIALIYWVLFRGDYSRFLILSDGVTELNYQTTLPKFRGNHLMAKMTAYISKDLKRAGYKKVMAVPHELNYPAIKCFERTGFIKISKIKTLGPLNKKMNV